MGPLLAVNSGLNDGGYQSTVPLPNYNDNDCRWMFWNRGGKGEFYQVLSSPYYTEEKILTVTRFNTTSPNIEEGRTEWAYFKNQIQQAEKKLTDLTHDLEAQTCRKQLRFDQWNSLQQQIKEAKSRIDQITEAINELESKPNYPNWQRLESAVAKLRQQTSSSSSVFGPLSQLTNILSQVVSSGIQLLIAAGVIAATALSGSWIPPAVAFSTALLLAGAFCWSQLIEQEAADQLNLAKTQALILSAWKKVKEKMKLEHLFVLNDAMLRLSQQSQQSQQKLDQLLQSNASAQSAQRNLGVKGQELDVVEASIEQQAQGFLRTLINQGLLSVNPTPQEIKKVQNVLAQASIDIALEQKQGEEVAHSNPKTAANQTLETQAALQNI